MQDDLPFSNMGEIDGYLFRRRSKLNLFLRLTSLIVMFIESIVSDGSGPCRSYHCSFKILVKILESSYHRVDEKTTVKDLT